MKYIGIDYGAKNIGIAVSDAGGAIAFPRAVLRNGGDALKKILEIIAIEKAERVVIGDTRSYGGAENPVTAKAESFIEAVARETGLPVSRTFEAFTSVEASRYAPEGSGHDDSAAAAVILQRFLDMKGASV